MKERPILFNTPMVRAILDGRKTQTRREIKPQPYIDGSGNFCWNGSNFGQDGRGPRTQAIASPLPCSKTKRVHCPFGKPGDRLWVRETWQGPLLEDDEQRAQYREDGSESFKTPEFCVYRATDELDAVDDDGRDLGWKPSIHMPRWASRILLEITAVRVERLQDIREDNALAEGVTFQNPVKPGRAARMGREAFADLWQSINGPGSWDANPWVWVIEFKRVQP